MKLKKNIEKQTLLISNKKVQVIVTHFSIIKYRLIGNS